MLKFFSSSHCDIYEQVVRSDKDSREDRCDVEQNSHYDFPNGAGYSRGARSNLRYYFGVPESLARI